MSLSVIDQFLVQYKQMSDEYRNIKEQAHTIVETALKDAGIMAITTSRIKDADRLREKLITRDEEKKYLSTDDISADIADLIGMRIALYFPNDREKVRALIYQLFDIEKEKQFPEEQRQSETYTRKFPGYCATHYRIYLKHSLNTKLGRQRIEIQVASLLMHAWAEVEHDLTYKQKKGTVSYDEHESLDEINGLVLAGELSLQRLQRISELRIASEGKKFQSHYQLASFLYEQAVIYASDPNPYLGDVETLFKLYEKKDRLTAKKIENDLLKVDWSDETPVAQQLIDLYANSSVNIMQLVISNKARKSFSSNHSAVSDSKIGKFLRKWVSLENRLSQLLLKYGYSSNRPGGIHRSIVESKILPNNVFMEYNILRQVRNKLVHAMEIPDESDFDRYMDLIDQIYSFLDDRNNFFSVSSDSEQI